MNIRDANIEATLDNSYTNGFLSVNTEIDNYKLEKGYLSKMDSFTLELQFLDPAGKIVYQDKTHDFKTVLG